MTTCVYIYVRINEKDACFEFVLRSLVLRAIVEKRRIERKKRDVKRVIISSAFLFLSFLFHCLFGSFSLFVETDGPLLSGTTWYLKY